MYTYEDLYKKLVCKLNGKLKDSMFNFINKYEKSGVTADFLMLSLLKIYGVENNQWQQE